MKRVSRNQFIAVMLCILIAVAMMGCAEKITSDSNVSRGNGNTGNGQGNTDFAAQGIITVQVENDHVMVGDEAGWLIELKNNDNRAMPDITLYVGGAKVMPLDANGMPANSIKNNSSLYYFIALDTSVAGTYSMPSVSAYSREGHKQWEYIFFNDFTSGDFDIVVHSPEIGWPEGISTDDGGNVLVLYMDVLPNSHAQGYASISLNGVDISGYNNRWGTSRGTVTVKATVAAGIYEIFVYEVAHNSNWSNVAQYIKFEVFVEDGKPVGAVIIEQF